MKKDKNKENIERTYRVMEEVYLRGKVKLLKPYPRSVAEYFKGGK